jgi:DNA invertase Pin-like site-specific DNA recombinase
VSDDDFLRVEAGDCPMSSCAAPAGSPCRTGKGRVAAQYHTARFRLVPRLAKALAVPVPPLRKPGAAWTELPRPAAAGTGTAGHVRIGYARASTVRQSLDTQADSLKAAGVTKIFAEKISTRAVTRPELGKAVALARDIRASGAAVTIAVHEHKRLGRGIELAALAEQLRAGGIGLEFLAGELQGSHDPSGIVFTVLAALSGMEREYIRDRTLEGHESAQKRGKTIGGAHRGVHAVHGSPPARAGDEPARHRQTARHHHGREEGTAPLARHRHADAARTRDGRSVAVARPR